MNSAEETVLPPRSIAESWPPLVRDEWEERVAILHADGGLPLRPAEHRAFLELAGSPIGRALTRAGDDPGAIREALERLGYAGEAVAIEAHGPAWRGAVASWPDGRWSAWRSRSGELAGPEASLEEIRRAEFAAYSEMTEGPAPDVAPVPPSGPGCPSWVGDEQLTVSLLDVHASTELERAMNTRSPK